MNSKKFMAISIIILALALLIGIAWWSYHLIDDNEPATEQKVITTNMKISSPAFAHNGVIPAKYTCEGEDINPPLEFSDVPNNARSLSLIVDDPDAPAGTWVHWLVWNIDPSLGRISEGQRNSDSLEGTTSFGRTGYGGPCPPSGTHRYFFKLYALDTILNLPTSASNQDLEKAMQGHIISQAELMGTYKKSK